tara:strand:- start:4924 stop:5820 length:897 start_codon:yes stop_codon:yes gene_type:complete
MAVFTKMASMSGRNRMIQLQQADYVPVIAEIGINHNGDLEVAKRLIDVAKRTGCDAVKFQKRDIATVYSEEVLNAPRESPWGATQRDQKNGLEFSREDYLELQAYSKTLNLAFSASAWDLTSLDFVESLEPEFHKVASALVTHEKFIRKIATFGRPTLVSTGMATIDEIDFAVGVFQEQGTPIILLHTVSTYPSPEHHLNLTVINSLSERYGIPVGYSGHEPSVTPSLVAVALGAVVVERHITLDRTMYGSDQSASLEENGLRSLVQGIRKIPALIGDGIKRHQPGELDVAKKLRYWL